MFDFIDERLTEVGCDDTLRHTIDFLAGEHINPDPVLAWLRKAGGFCDCEVIANAEETFESAFPASM